MTTSSVYETLLQSAVEIFAERGFRETTIREICNRAQVNIASVNYYFRSKEALYSQALHFAFQEANRLHPQTIAQDSSLAPEQRLIAFIDNFLHKLLDDSQLGCHGKLIAREISDPTAILDDILPIAIVPQFQLLQEILLKLVPKLQDDTALTQRCMLSILGQCLMFKHSRSVIDRLYPELIADDVAIQQCAQHISHFSLAALAQL